MRVLLAASCLAATTAFVPLSVHHVRPLNVKQSGFSRPIEIINHPAWTLNGLSKPDEATESSRKGQSTTTQPTPVLMQALSKASSAKTALATFLLGATLMLSVLPADAAVSGGRMGGSFSSPSRSSISPSRSSYSGGGSSYRGGSYSGGGYSSRYSYSSPTIVAPIITPSPFYFGGISPFYGGAGVGVVSTYRSGPNLFDLLFWGGIGAFFVSSIAKSWSRPWNEDDTSNTFSITPTSVLGSGVSVIRLSVALEVPNRDDRNSLLSVLDRLAATAQTGTRRGVQSLTSAVALELLRRKSSIQSAASSYKYSKDERVAQRQFSQWSVEERSKFEQENISKFGGIDTSPKERRKLGDLTEKATMAVVTMVVSIQGDSTVVSNKVQNMADVENALRKIASDAKVEDCLIGAEILWTPEDRNEVLTLKDIIADYPELTVV